jgi:hypothetical protein
MVLQDQSGQTLNVRGGDNMKRNLVLIGIILIMGVLFADEVQIGDGGELWRMPLDFWQRSSLCETIYYQEELGFASGTITTVKFELSFMDSLTKPIKVWMGVTGLRNLSAGWIPSSDLTLVFDGNITIVGFATYLTVDLQTPYLYNGGNLVVMVQRPMDVQMFNTMDFFMVQTLGFARTREAVSNDIAFDPANPPEFGDILTGMIPNTHFIYTPNVLVNDLGCLGVTGNVTPSVGSSTTYHVRVVNNGTATQSNYSVKLFREGDIEIGSIPGFAIQAGETQTYNLAWTPAAAGATYLYGRVVLAGDEVSYNSQSPQYEVIVQPESVVAVSVGSGLDLANAPIDFYRYNSICETVYLASELNIGGVITGMQYYNSAQEYLFAQPVTIWLGETQAEDLSGGWIPAGLLTQVFNSGVDFPNGQNVINIQFQTPYTYLGGNLVVMVQKHWVEVTLGQNDLFRCQPGGPAKTRLAYDWMFNYDPYSPPWGNSPINTYPLTTFFFNVQGMGALQGTVSCAGSPLAGATVTVANSTLETTTSTSGIYSFSWIPAGNHTVTATKHGYNSVSHTVAITEGQTATQDFALTSFAQVTVSGTVVGSDNTTAGLPNATVVLTGYETYSATTGNDGVFIFPSVYVNQVYNYTITHPGYQDASGQVVVGGTNQDMGIIIINEIATPVTQVIAAETADQTAVVVSWQAPARSLVGYRVWRLLNGFQDNEAAWTPLTPAYINALTYTDNAWQPLPSGVYLYAVKAIYSNNVQSMPAFSNLIHKGMMGVLAGVVTDFGTGQPVQGASIVAGQYEGVSDATGTYSVSIYAGTYNVSCVKAGYQTNNQANVIINGLQTTTLNFAMTELTPAPQSVQAIIAEPNVSLTWTAPTARILTGYLVWRMLLTQQGNEGSWISLTPEQVTELTLTDTQWNSLPNGSYLWAVKAVYTGGLLSPATFSNPLDKITEIGTIGGIVRNVSNAPIPGATVTAGSAATTTNSNGAYFLTVASGTYSVTASAPNYVSATQENVVVTTGQVTTVHFYLSPGSADDNTAVPNPETSLQDAGPNPFGARTSIRFTIKDAGPVCLEVFNLKGQLVRTLVRETMQPGGHEAVWDGTDAKGRKAPAGVYYYRMTASGLAFSKKMLLIH